MQRCLGMGHHTMSDRIIIMCIQPCTYLAKLSTRNAVLAYSAQSQNQAPLSLYEESAIGVAMSTISIQKM